MLIVFPAWLQVLNTTIQPSRNWKYLENLYWKYRLVFLASLFNKQTTCTNIITLEAWVRTKCSICMMNDRWKEALRFHPSKIPGGVCHFHFKNDTSFTSEITHRSSKWLRWKQHELPHSHLLSVLTRSWYELLPSHTPALWYWPQIDFYIYVCAFFLSV